MEKPINKKNRYYFRKDEIFCYTIENHLQYMRENHIEEMVVLLAKRVTNSDYFFCKHFNEIGEKSEGGCGKICKVYSPRNGKSGACKFVGYFYERTNERFILKVDSDEFIF